jgi:MFS family permease
MGDAAKLYKCGTLTYTRLGLFNLLAWLLWGDFVFNFMEVVAGSMLPLKLKYIGSPNWLIGLVFTTLPAFLSIGITPIIAMRSDNCRGKFGRRIPFLLLSTPFVAICLLFIGFSEKIIAVLNTFELVRNNQAACLLIFIAIMIIMFSFFNTIMCNAYIWLINDVVPPELITRFLAVFKIIGIGASASFQFFFFGMAKEYMQEIIIFSAIGYGIIFTLMCIFVKEGSYDKLEPNEYSFIKKIKVYFAECFTNKMYWYLYLAMTFWNINFAVVSFRVFFAESVGLSLDQYGKLMGIAGIISAVCLYPAGMLAEKYHPVRIMTIGIWALVAVVPLQLIFLFNVPANFAVILYMILFTIHIAVQTLVNAAVMPLGMKIFPAKQFGQLSSAGGLIQAVATITAGLLAGFWLDWLQQGSKTLDHYRYLPCWVSISLLISGCFMTLLWKEWQKSPQNTTPTALQ